ncbi:MAG: hypothetical protein ACTSRS_07715, partial [Candidatus Helarchaeota archaeon]
MFQDSGSITGICILFTVVLLQVFIIIKLMKKDERKHVVLRDFDGNEKDIGIYVSQEMTKTVPSIYVLNNKKDSEEWFLETDKRYSIHSVAVEYPTQLIIFTDFKRSNFNERRIYPLV